MTNEDKAKEFYESLEKLANIDVKEITAGLSDKFSDPSVEKELASYVPKTDMDPDENECDQCSMSQTMHIKYPKNTCGKFYKSPKGGITSHDGEARKDGWTGQR